MLDDKLKTQLKTYLERVTLPVELVSSLDDRPASQEMRELLDEIGELSDKVSVWHDGSDARRPSFSISRAGESMAVRFAAVPWVMSSARWSWRCCRPADTRPSWRPMSSRRFGRWRATSSSRAMYP